MASLVLHVEMAYRLTLPPLSQAGRTGSRLNCKLQVCNLPGKSKHHTSMNGPTVLLSPWPRVRPNRCRGIPRGGHRNIVPRPHAGPGSQDPVDPPATGRLSCRFASRSSLPRRVHAWNTLLGRDDSDEPSPETSPELEEEAIWHHWPHMCDVTPAPWIHCKEHFEQAPAAKELVTAEHRRSRPLGGVDSRPFPLP